MRQGSCLCNWGSRSSPGSLGNVVSFDAMADPVSAKQEDSLLGRDLKYIFHVIVIAKLGPTCALASPSLQTVHRSAKTSLYKVCQILTLQSDLLQRKGTKIVASQCKDGLQKLIGRVCAHCLPPNSGYISLSGAMHIILSEKR